MNQKGFAPIIILLVIAAGILIVGGTYYYVAHKITPIRTILTQTVASSTIATATTTSSSVSHQNTAYIRLDVTLPNGIVLTNASGEHVGRDASTSLVYSEIPNATYTTTIDGSMGRILFSNPPQGLYTLTITGASSSSDYGLVAYTAGNKNPVPLDNYFDGPIDQGQVVTYSLNYDPNAVANGPLIRTSISPPTAPLTTSSSTAQVGDFTVVANCTTPPESNDTAVTSIDIFKGNSIVQTISTDLDPGEGGGSGCLQPEAQDIVFDGYPGFMLPSDYGSGGESDEYWLFNTSTQQFIDSGGLMNPSFDATSKTVTSIDFLGAGDVDTETFQAVNGELVLVKDVETGAPNPSDITGPGLTIVKELIDGKMQIVSTSTNLNDE